MDMPQTHIMPGRMTKAWHCECSTYAQWEITYVYIVKAVHHIFVKHTSSLIETELAFMGSIKNIININPMIALYLNKIPW